MTSLTIDYKIQIMSIFFSIFTTILFFGILPLILGQAWKKTCPEGGFSFTYLSGFFTILAILELLSVPMIYKFVPVHIQVIIYSVIFIVLSGLILLNKIRSGFTFSFLESVKSELLSLSKYEWVYLIIFIAILLFEIYYAIFYDIAAWRRDDGYYVTLSNAAIRDDAFFITDSNADYTHFFSEKHGFCAIYVFYTYASVITGLGVAVIEHTICCVLLLLMAYMAFYLLSKTLFPREEERDNRLIFLIFTSLIFLFGLYSHYSITFRLFGVIWQGKAILAVIIVPFLLAVYEEVLSKGYTRRRALFLMTVSLAAISVTLGGILTLALITSFITLIHIIQTKNLKSIWGLISIGAFPLIYLLAYKIML